MMRNLAATLAWPFAALHSALRPGIRILMYHRILPAANGDQLCVSSGRFEAQMAWLADNRNLIRLSDIPALLSESGRLSGNAVAVTFDDGYLDNLLHALPIMRRHKVPSTIFVSPDFADQTHRHPRYVGEDSRVHLDWVEIRSMLEDSLVEIGSHTCTHPFLRQLDDGSAEREIVESKRRIEAQLDRRVDWFCYPSGDFGIREERLVRAAGYVGAVSVAPGVNRQGTSLTGLRRTEITDQDADREFRLKCRGAFDPFHWLLHRRREARFVRLAEARQ